MGLLHKDWELMRQSVSLLRMERTYQRIQVMCEIQWTRMKQTTISIVITLNTKQLDHYIMEIVHYLLNFP